MRQSLPSACFRRFLWYYELVGLPVSLLVALHIVYVRSHTAFTELCSVLQNLQDLSCSPASLLMPPRQALRPRKSWVNLAFFGLRSVACYQHDCINLFVSIIISGSITSAFVFGSATSLSYA